MTIDHHNTPLLFAWTLFVTQDFLQLFIPFPEVGDSHIFILLLGTGTPARHLSPASMTLTSTFTLLKHQLRHLSLTSITSAPTLILSSTSTSASSSRRKLFLSTRQFLHRMPSSRL